MSELPLVRNDLSSFRSTSFFCRASGRKTGPHFSWTALVRSGSVCILPKSRSGKGAFMALVRPVRQPQRANTGIGLGEPRLVGDTGPAVRLNRVVDDLQRHVGGRHLDHGDLELRGLVADLVHHVGGLEAQQPGHLDVGAGFCDTLFPDRMLDDLLAEGGARRQTLHHLLQSTAAVADGTHAVMDAAGTETALRDLKPPALAEQDIAGGNADVFKQYLGMAVRRVVVAEHRRHLLYR